MYFCEVGINLSQLFGSKTCISSKNYIESPQCKYGWTLGTKGEDATREISGEIILETPILHQFVFVLLFQMEIQFYVTRWIRCAVHLVLEAEYTAPEHLDCNLAQPSRWLEIQIFTLSDEVEDRGRSRACLISEQEYIVAKYWGFTEQTGRGITLELVPDIQRCFEHHIFNRTEVAQVRVVLNQCDVCWRGR